jgi:hypothetical protein
VQIRARIEPALRFEEAILVIWGLCADGHTNAAGRPSALLGALVGSRYRREIRYRQPPDAVQRFLFPPLAALARRRGSGTQARSLPRSRDAPLGPSGPRSLTGARDAAGGGNARLMRDERGASERGAERFRAREPPRARA